MAASILATLGLFVLPSLSFGLVIGSFAGGVAENGWGKWNDPAGGFNNGLPKPGVTVSSDLSTDGDGYTAKIDIAGNVQSLAYSGGVAGTIPDFMSHNYLRFDLVYAGTPTDPLGGGFNEVWEVVMNSQYGGFAPIGGASAGGSAVNPGTGFFEGWAPGTSDQRTHLDVTLDYRSIKQAWLDNGVPGWVELIFAVQDSNRPIKYIDNVRLVVPEPASMALLGLGGLMLVSVFRRR